MVETPSDGQQLEELAGLLMDVDIDPDTEEEMVELA